METEARGLTPGSEPGVLEAVKGALSLESFGVQASIAPHVHVPEGECRQSYLFRVPDGGVVNETRGPGKHSVKFRLLETFRTLIVLMPSDGIAVIL